jgi:ABC-type glycerol-3-phosphate transport system permease component
MILTSIKKSSEILVVHPVWIPKHPTLDNYLYVFSTARWGDYFVNSVIIGSSVTLLSIAVSSLAAYALSRFDFPGKNPYSVWILVVYMMPASFLAFPLYIIFTWIGLTDTYLAVILAEMSSILPFTIWILRGYFESIPRDLEEAGMIDGCSRLSALLRVVFPVALPGIAAAAAFAFIASWQEYLYVLVMISSDLKRTLPLGAAIFMGWASLQWGEIMAYSTLTALPALVFFAYLQKYLIRGLTQGAVKE